MSVYTGSVHMRWGSFQVDLLQLPLHKLLRQQAGLMILYEAGLGLRQSIFTWHYAQTDSLRISHTTKGVEPKICC